MALSSLLLVIALAKQSGTLPQPYLSKWCPQLSREGFPKNTLPRDLGISEPRVERIQNAIWKAATKVPFEQQMSMERLSKRLAEIATQQTLADMPEDKSPNLELREWMTAEAICAWVYFNVAYDFDLAKSDPGSTNNYGTGQTVLDRPGPKTICSGSALLTRDLSRVAGLRCVYVGGFSRGPGNQVGVFSNHAWVMYTFGKDVKVPADTTQARYPIAGYRCGGRMAKDTILPRTWQGWETFLALYFPKDESPIRQKDKQNQTNLLSVDFDQWKPLDTSHLQSHFNAFRTAEQKMVLRP